MTKSTDFLQRLSSELHETILGLLPYEDWCEVRLVSRQWYYLCQKRIWRNIAIASPFQMGELREIMLDYSNPAEVAGYSFRYQLVTYQQLKKLRSNQHFRKTVQENTVELAVYYAQPTSDLPYCLRLVSERDDKDTYEAISELFRHIRKVRVWYEPSPCDDRFLAFQNMLDGLKPTAEFSLAIEIYDFKGQAFLDIDGMKIKDL